jgi:hypothetical protein
MSICAAAKQYGVCTTTLSQHLKKQKQRKFISSTPTIETRSKPCHTKDNLEEGNLSAFLNDDNVHAEKKDCSSSIQPKFPPSLKPIESIPISKESETFERRQQALIDYLLNENSQLSKRIQLLEQDNRECKTTLLNLSRRTGELEQNMSSKSIILDPTTNANKTGQQELRATTASTLPSQLAEDLVERINRNAHRQQQQFLQEMKGVLMNQRK